MPLFGTTRASSTPGRAAACLALLLLTAGCASSPTGPAPGHAIKAVGPASKGTIGVTGAAVGNQYGFAFPILENDSTVPITITGYKTTNIPSGLKVIGYSVYSQNETTEYRLAYNFRPKETDFNLTKYHDYAGTPFTINPGKQGDQYAMVKVEVVGTATDHASGCQVDYTQSGKQYVQTVPCDFAVSKN